MVSVTKDVDARPPLEPAARVPPCSSAIRCNVARSPSIDATRTSALRRSGRDPCPAVRGLAEAQAPRRTAASTPVAVRAMGLRMPARIG